MSEISIESVSNRFKEHLSIDANYRIIFSAKFGTGKTFFLNKYFDERQDAYNKILISPVNYVVSPNEDIFELIKADIIQELFLTEKIKLTHLPEDTSIQKISKYFEENPLALPKFISKSLAKINPIIETPNIVLEAISKLIENYKQNIQPKSIDEKTRSEEIAGYLDESEKKLGVFMNTTI